MRILLIGECSNLHWNLAEGLRELGHEVCVAASDNGWRSYNYNISLNRPTNSFADGVGCLWRILVNLPKFRGYDVVQITHPYFLRIRSERALPVYHYLRKHNKKVFLGAFGTDYYYTKACMETNIFRYSDFKIGDTYRDTPINNSELQECLYGGTARANREIANTCNGIIACLWEYYVSYQPHFPHKTAFIPLPIDLREITPCVRTAPQKLNFFIGIQSERSDVKGTDVMLPVLQAVQSKYPDLCSITQVQNVPYLRYRELMDEADVQIDQLYSYTPSMNSLLAMAKGIVVVGGGEPENYQIINEMELKPIINVLPCEEDIYKKLEDLVLNRHTIPLLSQQSIEYVAKHHHYVKVAAQYVEFWDNH